MAKKGIVNIYLWLYTELERVKTLLISAFAFVSIIHTRLMLQFLEGAKGGEKMPIKVQKKDGTTEDFDRGKVLSGLTLSGANPQEAEEITKQIESWIATAAVNGIIASSNIRAKLLELLASANPVVKTAYEAYQKPAETPQPTV